MMIDLKRAAEEIRQIISKKQEELELSFVESTHTYYIKNEKGVIINNYPSVSTIIDKFYEPFDAEKKALQKCNGNIEAQQILLNEWAYAGKYSTDIGSRVHYELEKELVGRYGNYKSLREPEYEVNAEQIQKSDNMIIGGKKFLDLMMFERKVELLDTECVMGSNNLRYFGTPDKLWLALNKTKTEILLYCTDWKTNQPKNFVPQWFTKKLFSPFNDYWATSLEHYYIQLPLYVRLLLDMLKGSKYENIRLAGCIVVLLKDDGTFEEYRVPNIFQDVLLNIDLSEYVELKQETHR